MVSRAAGRLIRWRDGKAGVFVDTGGRAAWRNLKLGMAGANHVEVETA